MCLTFLAVQLHIPAMNPYYQIPDLQHKLYFNEFSAEEKDVIADLE